MPTITAPDPTTTLGNSVLLNPSVLLEPPDDIALGWEIERVTNTGAVVAQLARSKLKTLSWRLNDYGTASFEFGDVATPLPSGSTDTREIDTVALVGEIKIRYGGRLVWWGTIVRPEDDSDSAMVDVQCAELLWYLKHRFVGRASRTNLLENGSFEDPASGAWALNGVAGEYSTARAKLGTLSLRLTQANALVDTYAYQDVLNYQATGVGTLLTLVGWFFIEDDGSWVGEAIGKRGLTLSRLVPAGGPLIASRVYEIDGDTPRGSWQRTDAISGPETWMPPDAIEDLEVRCYAPGGVINWDAIQLVIMESLSSVSSATDFTMDQATIMENLVIHSQDASVGKDSLNIGTSCPLSGIRRERHYQYAEHAEILGALQEFPSMDRGTDFRIEITETTRTFTTGTPHIGTDRTATHHVYRGRGGNVVRFRRSIDGENYATSVTTLGKGSGPDREEGGATSGATPVVEVVIAEPLDADIDFLAEFATQRLATFSDPEILEVGVFEPDWIGVVLPGDLVRVTIEDPDAGVGYTVLADVTYRVVEAACDPTTLVLSLTLNKP